MTDLMIAGLSSGLVLAAMAAMAVLDARRAVVDPRLVLALLAAAAVWRYLSPDDDSPWTPWTGMALGIAAVALPIIVAQLRGRRWPLYPGDAMMLGAFGFLLGPIGLAWTMLLGSAFSLAYRVWVQRRRGRPVRKNLVPLGPGMTAGAAVVFLCVNFGVAFAAGEPPPHGVPAVTGTAAAVTVSPLPDIAPGGAPLPATELAPASTALPEAIATRELVFEQREAVSFPAALRRLSSLSGIATAIEERPARIAGGTAILSDAPPIRLVWRGALAGLLDRLAALSGYDWSWREGTVVFYRYWDIEQRAAAAGSADRVDEVASGRFVDGRGGGAQDPARRARELGAPGGLDPGLELRPRLRRGIESGAGPRIKSGAGSPRCIPWRVSGGGRSVAGRRYDPPHFVGARLQGEPPSGDRGRRSRRTMRSVMALAPLSRP